ncbi:MAG: hypothetical protein L3J24_01260 [Xanthomonadales bacterium]|nr:hypothetical protein [Xanthomonadales bacterium]
MKFPHSIPIRDTKRIKLAILAISVSILFLNVVLFTYYNAIPLVKSDGWRFIQLFLVPWYEGSFQWQMLWADHHPQPLVALLFIANSELFGLRMDYEALFSVIVSMAVFLQLAKLIKKSFGDDKDSTYFYLALFLIALFLFSLTSRVVYVWSLVTLVYVFLFFAVSVARVVNTGVRQPPIFRNWVFLSISLVLFLITFGNAALLFIMATCIVVFMQAIIKRNINSVYMVGLIVVAVLAQTIFYEMVISGDKYSVPSAWIEILGNVSYFKEYLFYIGISLLSVWVNIAAIMTENSVNESLVTVLGVGVLGLYIVSLFVYARSGLFNETILPAIFIITAILMAAGAAVFRFDPEMQAVSAVFPRHYLNYVLAPIGVIWIWCYVAVKSDFVRTKVVLIGVFSLVVIGSQIFSATKGWKASPFIREGIVELSQIMESNANGALEKVPQRAYVGGNFPKPYLQGLDFLKKQQLSIFSGDDFIKKYEDPAISPEK